MIRKIIISFFVLLVLSSLVYSAEDTIFLERWVDESFFEYKWTAGDCPGVGTIAGTGKTKATWDATNTRVGTADSTEKWAYLNLTDNVNLNATGEDIVWQMDIYYEANHPEWISHNIYDQEEKVGFHIWMGSASGVRSSIFEFNESTKSIIADITEGGAIPAGSIYQFGQYANGTVFILDETGALLASGQANFTMKRVTCVSVGARWEEYTRYVNITGTDVTTKEEPIPFAYYPLDINANDYINNNDLTINGSPTNHQDASCLTAGCYEFGGVEDFLMGDWTYNKSKNLTISAWIWSDTNSAPRSPWGFLNSDGNAGLTYYDYYAATQKWYIYPTAIETTNYLGQGEWNYHTFVMHNISGQVNNDYYMYINGEIMEWTTTSPMVDGSLFAIGRPGNYSDFYWDGRMDEVIIYDDYLSHQQIVNLYENNGIPEKYLPTTTYTANAIINSTNSNLNNISGWCNITSNRNETEMNVSYTWYKNGEEYYSASSVDYYQETAGTIISAPDNPYVYFIYNYSEIYQEDIWEVKHGWNGSEVYHYNITLSNECINTTDGKYYLRTYARVYNDGAPNYRGVSYVECYNQSINDWNQIGIESNILNGGDGSSVSSVTSLYDGDWATGAHYSRGAVLGNWWARAGGNSALAAEFYEEALWRIGNPLPLNEKTLVSTLYNNTDYTIEDNFILECSLLNSTGSILTSGNSSQYNIDQIAPQFSNNETSETISTPQIGEVFYMNLTVTDNWQVDNCTLQMNDTGVWEDKENFSGVSFEPLVMNYTIQNYSITNMSHIGWRVQCNDPNGNTNTSDNFSFTVKDVSFPLFIFNPNNGFKEDNTSVKTSYLEDLQLNLTLFDFNLFQAMINITCSINESLYYSEILDINDTSYTFDDLIPLNNQTPQTCTVFLSGSDDHTDEVIGKYDVEKVYDGLKYKTTEDINIEILTKDDTKWFDGIDTEKTIDRYSFEFKFKEAKQKREFKVKSDKKIYPRDRSEYPGHFVIWNEETKSGNWIDFADVDEDIDKYSIVRISDYEYDVIIESNQAKDVMKFNSLGGTNILNATYIFYIGGAVNVSSFNRYDNTTFDNFSIYIETISSSLYVNETINVTGNQAYIGNLSNGTYSFTFFRDNYFNQTYIVDVISNYTNQTYNTFQSIVNILIKNIATGTYITDFSLTLTNNDTGQVDVFNSSSVTGIATRYINASNYTVFIETPGYDNSTNIFTTEYYDNLTIIYNMNFLANFILYDERTLGLFNVTGPDTINFLLFCPDSTYTTIINETSTSIPINCEYEKFKFVLDYGVTSYYRTFILEPDEAFNVSVYLIDGITTQYLYNSLILDDLLSTYDNPSIYVKKIIGNETVQITADFVDVENKIGAYLIESNEYIIELHSDNYPTRILGTYSADLAGPKTLRLYEIGITPEPSSYINSVSHSVGLENRTTDTFAVAVYNDSLNQTNSVTWTIYENTYGGPVLHTLTTTEPNFIMEFNMTPHMNKTTVSILEINHQQGTYDSGRILHEFSEIVLGILEYISQDFLNWFFTILIGVFAIMATIRTANAVSMAMVGLSALFVIFGWYKLSWGILALAIIFSLLALLKEGERG